MSAGTLGDYEHYFQYRDPLAHALLSRRGAGRVSDLLSHESFVRSHGCCNRRGAELMWARWCVARREARWQAKMHPVRVISNFVLHLHINLLSD
ncbi:hypothetical protein PWR63_23900 [Paraburkholderia sp. A2WS-5]|uniref:hypothetical protein n=1 Tax=unclassified Paraburkholderia TaxID=2615204 RepID=UPI003B771856